MHDHWRLFAEFCRYEKACGGPDPQLAMVHGMSRNLPVHEQVWRAGCYGAVYNTGGGLFLWNHLSRAEAIDSSEDELRDGLADIWHGLPFRRERRAVRTPLKLARHLRSYALASRDWPDRDWWTGSASRANYEAAWTDVLKVYGVGRYIAIKLLELFSRFGAGTAAYDIRAKDAWSPRRTLALLWPYEERILCEDGSRRGNGASEAIADTTIARLHDDYGVDVTHFELQVMTCEYRESIESRRQYPGHSHDSEDKYLRQLVAAWDWETAKPGYEIRAELFPAVSLGELSGWQGNREELGNVAADHGYTWSDLVYDWGKTHDLAMPARREVALL